MSLFGLERGLPQTDSAVLTLATTNYDIVTATGQGKDSGVDVTDVLITNQGTATTVTLSRYDGVSATFYLLYTYPLAAAGSSGSYIHLTFPFRLPRSWSVRAQSAGAAQVTVNVTYMQPVS